ncbi:hypothetical protein FisN_3Hh053 [Fistulifera solaris]|jgi:hypothetical protein|uniref:ShKT domain-containing protein n=1 Tax=Fistulifera solaris TaxID=1519565 RepID=A0A1Z5JNL3_FISSO|nr:hypothetical protein FisN_3Hh053 [Fistulifera solaris]|eukprot:GAX15584.1 hypothetical protein FisN_3Hh053 [Fistulifera solaris]
MPFRIPILSLLSLLLFASVNTVVRGDGTVNDDSCPNELAAYEACALSKQNICESECQGVDQNPEWTEEQILNMLEDPNFLCNWFNEIFCAIQQCCNACQAEANAYFGCVASQTTEDGTCSFVCDDNGGAVDDGNDNEGTVDDGNDSGAVDGGSDGGAVDDGSDNGGTGTDTGAGGGSSASFTVSTTTLWTGAVMFVGYGLL